MDLHTSSSPWGWLVGWFPLSPTWKRVKEGRKKKKKNRWRRARTSRGQQTDHHHSKPGLHSYVSCLPDTTCAGAKWCMWSLWGKGVPSITHVTASLKANQANSTVSPGCCSPVLALGMSWSTAQSRSRECTFPDSPDVSSTLTQHLPPNGVNCTEETVVNKMQVTVVITGSFGQVIHAQCLPTSLHTQGAKSLLSQSRGFTAWDIKHMRGWGHISVLDKEENWL